LEPDDPNERDGLRVVLRALIGGVLIMLSTAAAVTAAVLLEVDDVKKKFFSDAPPVIVDAGVTRAEAGGPRTFLLLGSDERFGDRLLKVMPRSDTMLLIRADPGKKVVTVTSIPRDLHVTLPGLRVPKINSAYENGGPKATVKALKAVFAQAGAEPLVINHVLNLDFRGFRRAVNYVGGVYVDVDRRYFNDNLPPRDSDAPYATIDVQPGYQRLHGQDALDYVRYRHGDDDFLRASRQQDFLRQIKSQSAVRSLLRLQERDRLTAVFGRYVQVDDSFKSTQTLLGLLKLGAYLEGSTVQTVRFAGTPYETETGSYVEASPDQLRSTLDKLMHPASRARVKKSARPRRAETDPEAFLKGLERSPAPVVRTPRRLPYYAPARRAPGARLATDGVRAYKLETLKGRTHRAYRLVFHAGGPGDYYGVQGTTWRDPPILRHPDHVRRIGGRRLLTFSDGGRLRLVGWRTEKGVYWVSNTLTRELSNRQMIGIALSMKRVRR
jgi:LCP family protein required for cell wall assembly